MKRIICCLCHKPIIGYGNNPWPISTNPEDRCCDVCNYTKVIPARLEIARIAKENSRITEIIDGE